MISAVSGVSFKGTTESDFQKLIQSEGNFSNKNGAAALQTPAATDLQPSKEGKAGKVIGGILAAVVIAGLTLFGLKRGDVIKVDDKATGFVGKTLSKLAKAGEWIGTKIVDPVTNLFKGKSSKEVKNDASKKSGEEVKQIFANIIA